MDVDAGDKGIVVDGGHAVGEARSVFGDWRRRGVRRIRSV